LTKGYLTVLWLLFVIKTFPLKCCLASHIASVFLSVPISSLFSVLLALACGCRCFRIFPPTCAMLSEAFQTSRNSVCTGGMTF
jgi:hypothetical protein